MDHETCSITGGKAYASFKGGFGSAWYGSDRDTRLMVDLSGTLAGPVADGPLESLIAKGEVVVYGSYMDGLLEVSKVDPEVAFRLFRRGAQDQNEQLAVPQVPAVVRSAKARVGGASSVTLLLGGATCVTLLRGVEAPAWQAPVQDFVAASDEGVAANDFRNLGRLWRLTLAATHADSSASDPVAMRAASDDCHRFALEVESAVGKMRDGLVSMFDSLDERCPKSEQEFTVRVRMPSPETDIGEVSEALYESGCSDSLVSTTGDGVLRVDFTREAHTMQEAIRSAIRDVCRRLPEGYALIGVDAGL